MADKYILEGAVEVNGEKIINPATKVLPSDKIKIKGKLLQSRPSPLYLMMNKPIQVICSLRDPQRRTTVIDILPKKYKDSRVYPVGRLDYFSEGLLLLTNDGDLANTLMHPRFNHTKKYDVIIRGKPEAAQLEKLKKGMFLEGKIKLLPIEVQERALKDGNTCLIMTLKQGINRQIRRICDQFGWVILKLKRISEAGLTLGDLKAGECRELTADEITSLKALQKNSGLNK